MQYLLTVDGHVLLIRKFEFDIDLMVVRDKEKLIKSKEFKLTEPTRAEQNLNTLMRLGKHGNVHSSCDTDRIRETEFQDILDHNSG